MTRKPDKELRRGWTTGACATAAVKAALLAWNGPFPKEVQITLPNGETPVFEVETRESGEGFRGAGIRKDAGDDPDVTHNALIFATVCPKDTGGVVFKAGDGVGIVTKPGLPIAVGEPAINPVPRQMMTQVVQEISAQIGRDPHVEICISVAGGEALAQKTWNPRLGIEGGISILGTTGIVRPFSCAAWIASIHRGIDVARADGLEHVAGCTGNTSEKVVQALHKLPDHAMLDMGDFVGGMIKYMRRHPVKRLTVGGGIGKMTKLAQGAVDLHSGRSQVDFGTLALWGGPTEVQRKIRQANTALEALHIAGPSLAERIAREAASQISNQFQGQGQPEVIETIVIDRDGTIVGQAVLPKLTA